MLLPRSYLYLTLLMRYFRNGVRKVQAYLYLENGEVFEGKAFGGLDEVVGEVVFNTGMTGYQEVLTDPSYWGQIVCMTYPLIGNYGINLDDGESNGIKVKGFIVRDRCEMPNNFRCEMELESYLIQNKIPAIEGIDTRALTKILRETGTMKGVISLKQLTHTQQQHRFNAFHNKEAVSFVSSREKTIIENEGMHIAVMDFGIKNSIINALKRRKCKITIFPYNTTAEELLSEDYHGIFLSNGPGDPMDLPQVIEEIKKIIHKKPLLGICLGHQLLALALGGETKKLKFGHRGVNHPVKDLESERVMMTSQNHGYYVSRIPQGCRMTHIHVNDETVEGIQHNRYPIYSVQFHPEASPGPKDADYIFDEFLEFIKNR